MIGIPTFGADGGKSGISTYLIALLREWARVGGLPLEILHFPDEHHLFMTSPQFTSLAVDPFWRKPLYNLVWNQICLPYHAARRGYKVLFMPAGNRRVPFWAPCPTVSTVHDLASLHVRDKYDKGRVAYVTRVLPALLRRQTHLIAVSECSKRDIIEHVGYPEERITVIYEAADNDIYFRRDPQECREFVGRHHNITRPYVLYIARIEHPGKNHIRLLRAFDRLKSRFDSPHILVLAGSDWDRAEEVHRVHQQCRHRDDIHFTGFFPSASLPYLYGGASLFCFPSLFEGFGLPLLEAMACGVPVASSDRASLPEIAGDAAALFDPESEEQLEETLLRLLQSQDEREQLVQRGLARQSQFSWRKAAAETMQLLNRVAEVG